MSSSRNPASSSTSAAAPKSADSARVKKIDPVLIPTSIRVLVARRVSGSVRAEVKISSGKGASDVIVFCDPASSPTAGLKVLGWDLLQKCYKPATIPDADPNNMADVDASAESRKFVRVLDQLLSSKTTSDVEFKWFQTYIKTELITPRIESKSDHCIAAVMSQKSDGEFSTVITLRAVSYNHEGKWVFFHAYPVSKEVPQCTATTCVLDGSIVTLDALVPQQIKEHRNCTWKILATQKLQPGILTRTDDESDPDRAHFAFASTVDAKHTAAAASSSSSSSAVAPATTEPQAPVVGKKRPRTIIATDDGDDDAVIVEAKREKSTATASSAAAQAQSASNGAVVSASGAILLDGATDSPANGKLESKHKQTPVPTETGDGLGTASPAKKPKAGNASAELAKVSMEVDASVPKSSSVSAPPSASKSVVTVDTAAASEVPPPPSSDQSVPSKKIQRKPKAVVMSVTSAPVAVPEPTYISSKNSVVEALRDQIAKLHGERAVSTQNERKLERQVESLKRELAASKTNLSQTEKTRDVDVQELQEKHSKAIHELTATLDATKAAASRANDDYNKRLKSLDASIRSAAEKAEKAAQAEREKAVATLAAQRETIAGLTRELEQLRSSANEQKKQISLANDDSESKHKATLLLKNMTEDLSEAAALRDASEKLKSRYDAAIQKLAEHTRAVEQWSNAYADQTPILVTETRPALAASASASSSSAAATGAAQRPAKDAKVVVQDDRDDDPISETETQAQADSAPRPVRAQPDPRPADLAALMGMED